MPIVNWSVSMAIGGGPSVKATSALTAEAYSVIEVAVDGGAAVAEPFSATDASDLDFILITSTHYDENDLEYTLGGETIALDEPQLFAGSGMLSRFADDVTEINVDNSLADRVTVTVLVGRAEA
jgi:hypothetical protein